MILTDVTRKQAFLMHLSVSGAIFIAPSYLIIFHWYPGFYFFLDGGDRAIVTVFFVNVVLGPGLTLLVFKQGKKGLKFDMTMIVLMQLSALVWGVNKVYTERSATTVFYQGNFTCISWPDTTEVNMTAIEQGPSGSQRLSFLKRPDTIDGLLDFSMQAFAHRSSPVYYYGELIESLDLNVVGRLNKYKLDMDELRLESAAYSETVETYLDTLDSNNNSYKLVPLTCRYANKIAVYDLNQLKIIDTLDVPTRLSANALDEPLPLKVQLEQRIVNSPINDTMKEIQGSESN